MEGEKAILEWNDVTTQSIQGQHSPNSDVYEKLANLVKFVENDEHHLELLSNIKVNSYVLVHLLKATRNVQNLTNVLTLIKALSADKKSHELFHSDLAKLLDILSQLALGYSSIVLPEDSLTSILEIINHIFKQKTNMIILYQSTETMELLPQLRKMLEYKSRPGGKKLAKKMAKAAATAFLSIARHREGRRLLNNSEGLIDSLYLFLLFAPEDKAFDTVVHKVGLTILSCIPLQNLPGLGDAHSAFVGPVPCAECSNGTEYALSSDSHTESEPEEDDKKNTIDNKSKKIYKSNNTMPANFFRKMEDLDQYRRHIDVSIDSNSSDDELFTKDYNSIPREWTRNQIYEHYARSVRATNGFYLIPFPDWSFAKHHTAKKESCYIKDRMVCRRKLMRMLELAVRPDSYHPKLVYDLDSLLLNANETKSIQMIDDDVSWTNYKGDSESDSLHFESRFESGNLRRAYRVSEYEYDLILNPDVNSTGRQQWFYFRLSGPGVCSNVPYTFNIINFEKQRSLFNQGMQPVMFSVKQSLSTGNAEWARKGSSICYYRNVFQRGDADQPYFTLSFDISFPYDHDIIYIALHYPYTYSQLMTDVVLWKRSFPQQIENVNFRVTTLCTSPCQNPVPLVIIGSNEELSKCKVNFCSARVHPSESNSSWVVRGFIDAIMTAAVVQLEDSDHNLFQDKLFMIVPMLNIDGVVHGCRCENTNEDLNRKWLNPDPQRHPSIYHTKGLLSLIHGINSTPVVCVDIHGHSRRFNVFLYGCSGSQSWLSSDRLNASLEDSSVENTEHNGLSFPPLVRLLHLHLESLDVDQCNFEVEKERESTLRIVAWRHLSITHSYTLECSLAGFTINSAQEPIHYNTMSYEKIGSALHQAIMGTSAINL